MPRLPYLERVTVDLTLPRSEEALWKLILKLDEVGPWTARMIADATQINPGTPRRLLRRLLQAGIAAQVGEHRTRGKNPQAAPLYRLTRRPLEMPRLNDDGSERLEPLMETLWRTMKMAKTFTLKELAALAEAEGSPVNQSYVGGYCNTLVHAGVLAKIPSVTRETRYRLLRNVGQRAPKILQGKIVFDPNARSVLGTVVAVEARP